MTGRDTELPFNRCLPRCPARGRWPFARLPALGVVAVGGLVRAVGSGVRATSGLHMLAKIHHIARRQCAASGFPDPSWEYARAMGVLRST
jgi:hypothetical protein